MLKLLVAGGFVEESKDTLTAQREFAAHLGREIIAQGHTLLNACSTTFDSTIAEAAYEHVRTLGGDAEKRIISYVLANQKPAHKWGTVLQSQLRDWELGSPRLRIPEPIQLADAVIAVGGYDGTHRAANWARIAKKPLLPVTLFGGSAAQIYEEELDSFFDDRYGASISRAEYSNLSQVNSPLETFARTVVNLAERVRTSRSVFVIMSFSNDPALQDLYESYKTVCEELKYDCSRVDDNSDVPRIIPEIWRRIATSAFSVVDLTVPSPNVYFELGYAEALGRNVIVTAKEGTVLPFDVKDIPVIFWVNQSGLKSELRKKVQAIASTQGR